MALVRCLLQVEDSLIPRPATQLLLLAVPFGTACDKSLVAGLGVTLRRTHSEAMVNL